MTVLPGDLVHLSEPGKWYDNLFLLVEEVRAWGVIGIVRLAQGDAPLRASWNCINGVYRKVEPIN